MQDPTNLVNKFGIQAPSPLHAVTLPEGNHGYSLYVKRDDLLHPIISGNKWRKLQGHLHKMQTSGMTKCISFGGGFSNHLHALGYCCKQLDIDLTAIVRGDYNHQLTPMLQDLAHWGATLTFVDRKTYQLRDDPNYLAQLSKTHPEANLIPEGGSDTLALSGVAALLDEIPNLDHFDYLLCPVASAGTFAALAKGMKDRNSRCQLIGIAMLKGEGYLEELASRLLPNGFNLPPILHRFHCGGYAKKPDYLEAFCQALTQSGEVPVEPVYSGKLFYALQQLTQAKYFPRGSAILALHTGGLQGAR